MNDKNSNAAEQAHKEAKNSRRNFLATAGGVVSASALRITQTGTVLGEDDEFCPIRQDRSADTILEGTELESPVYTIESQIPGPTVVVVGGLQGNEPIGWTAANKMRN